MRMTLGTLRRVLREAAVTAKQSGAKGLALHTFDDSSEVRQVVIYSPQAMLSYIEPALMRLVNRGKPISSEALFDKNNLRIGEDAFVGMLTLAPPLNGQCNNAWEVKSSAANGGYGPLVYDLALGLSPTNTLMPDRHSVSGKAGMIWQYYAGRRGDVEKLPLDNIRDPKTPPKVDDCSVFNTSGKEYLDVAYKAKSKVDPERLKANHDRFADVIEGIIADNGIDVKGDIRSELGSMIGEFADSMFLTRMRNG